MRQRRHLPGEWSTNVTEFDQARDRKPVRTESKVIPMTPTVAEAGLPELVRRTLELLGEDPQREGLRRTPVRVESSLRWLTRGYGQSVDELVRGAIFEEPHESMILVRDVEIYSMCEHHMLPFFGKAHVAYLPAGKIIGLSKIPRVVDVFARRLQVQERLTDQIADALMRVLEPQGVGVVVEAYHLCMMMRGVEKQNSKTVTSALRGNFLDGTTRDEFLRLAHGGSWLE
jgi:GTP cyclohydrolase I